MSFVPTSWFLWTLSYFYIFFFIVFRYCKVSLGVKVALVCGLVLTYTLLAPHIGISSWRFQSNPGFCIGMIFALFDERIRVLFVRWQVFLALCLVYAINRFIPHPLTSSCLYPVMFFMLMYIIRGVKENAVVKFISSISLEMFIIQYIPIYIMMNDLHIKQTVEMCCLTLGLDVALAYVMHWVVQRISVVMK